jgi:hypothetical protein
MMFARGEELIAIPILAMIFGFGVLMTRIANRERERRDRVRLAEQALKAERLDPDVRNALLSALRPAAPHSWWQSTTPAKLCFAIGWIGMFLGIGLLCFGYRYDEQMAGGMIAGIGFALASLPIAIRELERRRA